MIPQYTDATGLIVSVIGLLGILVGVGEVYRRRGFDDTDFHKMGRDIGEKVGRGLSFIVGMYIKLLGSFVKGILKYLPGSGSIGDSLIVTGHKIQMRNYDAIVNVIYGDGVIKPRPATWQSEETAFKTANDEWFSAKGIGFNPKRLNGKVPVVWALRNSNEVTEPLEAAIARARRMGRFLPYEQPGGDPDVAVDVDPNNFPRGEGAAGRQAARADGGAATPELDGTALSFREGYELFGSKVDQEDMKDAEKRGKLAAINILDGNNELRVVLYVLMGVALGLFGPAIAGQIAGGAAGGLGGGLPELGGFGLWLLPVGVL